MANLSLVGLSTSGILKILLMAEREIDNELYFPDFGIFYKKVFFL